MCVASMPGFLYFGLIGGESRKKGLENNEKGGLDLSKRIVGLLITYNFLQFLLISNMALGLQLPLFAHTASHLTTNLSRANGSSLSIIFFTCHAVCRLITALLSSLLPARKAIWPFLALYVGSCAYVLARGDGSLGLTELQACVAAIALGAGPLFSFTLALFEGFFPVTPQLASLMNFGEVVGLKFYMVVIGHIIEDMPESLFALGIVASISFPILVLLEALRPKIIISSPQEVRSNQDREENTDFD